MMPLALTIPKDGPRSATAQRLPPTGLALLRLCHSSAQSQRLQVLAAPPQVFGAAGRCTPFGKAPLKNAAQLLRQAPLHGAHGHAWGQG
jgi:hypothetical protein